jgi:hypothetical protein
VSIEAGEDWASSRVPPGERARALLRDSPHEPLLLEQLAERALGLVQLPALTERENRPLRVAAELSHGVDEATRRALRHHVRVYVGLASSSWAMNASFSRDTRIASVVAAVALAAISSENLREVMGLNARLRGLATLDVHRDLGLLAVRVAAAGQVSEAEVARALGSILDRLDAPSDPSPVRKTPEWER